MSDLESSINEKIGEVRFDSLDLSYGELISLYQSQEFIISPDFQRFFRWDDTQKSRLIESVLLGLPIPQIFLIENQDGVLELIDGLQRISSVIQFIDSDVLRLDALTLEGCELVTELNGMRFMDLPLPLRLGIKRSAVRAVLIKKQSSEFLRYAMFKRLNTGGSALSDQEIRNCTARMIGTSGVEFYEFLRASAAIPSFETCIAPLPDNARNELANEELVLRFLALKNGRDMFRMNVRNWLDEYMEKVILGEEPFNYQVEAQEFARLFDFLAGAMGEHAFVRFRDGRPIGAVAPAHFEAVSLGTWNNLNHILTLNVDTVKNKLIETVQSDEFKQYVGPGSNSLTKFNGRINTVSDALQGLQ